MEYKGKLNRYQKDFNPYQPYQAFIYLWYDAINRKYYLGSHCGTVCDGYAHSSRTMRPFTTRKIPEGFRRRILEVGTRANIPLRETELIRKHGLVAKANYYNVMEQIPDHTDKIRSHTARENYRMAQLRRKYPDLESAWQEYLEVLKEVRRQEGLLKNRMRRHYNLTAEQVAYIRSKPCHHSVQKQLALEFNCNPTRIYYVQKGKSYSWLPMPTDVPQVRYRKTVLNGKPYKSLV